MKPQSWTMSEFANGGAMELVDALLVECRTMFKNQGATEAEIVSHMHKYEVNILHSMRAGLEALLASFENQGK